MNKNAIEERLDTIETLWNGFAEDKEARLLRWLVDADESRMIDIFLEVQNEEGSTVPDLFIRFDEPFEAPDLYGFTLRESLRAKYEEIREPIRQENIDAAWQCPSTQSGEIGIQAFLRACQSLQKHYETLMANLVIALMPRKIADDTARRRWLTQLAAAPLTFPIKFMVVDSLEQPVLEIWIKRFQLKSKPSSRNWTWPPPTSNWRVVPVPGDLTRPSVRIL